MPSHLVPLEFSTTDVTFKADLGHGLGVSDVLFDLALDYPASTIRLVTVRDLKS